MSYSINISGHKETSGAEESEEFEREVLERAKEFISSLDGVTGASGSFSQLGYVDLKEG